MPLQQVVSPIDGSVYAERETVTSDALERVLAEATAARDAWRQTSLAERAAVCERMVAHLESVADEIAVELAHQMGRPVRFGGNEIRGGFQERARHMISIAADRLADIDVDAPDGFRKFIRRDPLGSVLVVAPWNYPYLCAVNSVVPALLAGNTVVLKHATQTLLCAERMSEVWMLSFIDPLKRRTAESTVRCSGMGMEAAASMSTTSTPAAGLVSVVARLRICV